MNSPLIILRIFVAWTLLIAAGRAQEQLAAELHPNAVLTFRSIPDSASVYIDSVWYGRTPITIDSLHPGSRMITIVREFHTVFSRSVDISTGSSDTLTAILSPLITTAHFSSNSHSTLFTLRPFPVTAVTGTAAEIRFGRHLVTAHDTITGVKVADYLTVTAKEPLSIHAEMNVLSPLKIARGFAVPGLVQYEDEHETKSLVMFGLAAGSSVLAGTAVINRLLTESNFTDAQTEYRAAGNTNLADRAHRLLAERHDELSSAISFQNGSLTLLAIVWAVNAADVLWNHNRSGRIEQRGSDMQLSAISGGGISLSYKREF